MMRIRVMTGFWGLRRTRRARRRYAPGLAQYLAAVPRVYPGTSAASLGPSHACRRTRSIAAVAAIPIAQR
jgi:hypothetical protein